MSDRRETQERRDKNERRRHARRLANDDQGLVLELNGSELSAVELQRVGAGSPETVSAIKMTWRKEATTLNSETGMQELTEAIQVVAKHFNLQTPVVHLVLSGEFCVTRAIRGTNEEVRAELQRLSQRSRLYLSLGPGEKVIVSKTRTLDARHQYALAAVCNSKTLSTIQLAAESTGLHIASIEPALSAANRAICRISDVPETPYLLIHLDESTPDIGVCHGGQLLLDYRPGGRANPAELPALLSEHLNRLQRHTGRQLHAPPPELRKVYLCGQENSVEAALESFAKQGQFEVSRATVEQVDATWTLGESASRQAGIPALGALLSNFFMGDSEPDGPNLMEHIIASTREPLKPTLIRSAIPIAATLLVAAVIGMLNQHMQSDIDALQANLDELAPAQARATELRLQLMSSQAKLTEIKTVAEQLGKPLGSHLIEQLGNCMPGDVWLSHLNVTNGTAVQIQGSSFLEAGVYDFVHWLEQSPAFAEVALKSTSAGSSKSGPITGFNLELDVAKFNDQTDLPVEKVAHNE
ncbi:PilN domain-containing protein [Adhaeretor mobilis]|uniref:Fimbrial assembly protein (PilN) n=1 Tax=Adhaeretor mobilis TaxID=1930276 RepID=A0A517MWV9_9BACT|nr:PilN domain-containing protein [Adhaeretor mobilis]QDS99362.1 Fimbrial assembly protein (PilN) [Adhaeretor mobilis]